MDNATVDAEQLEGEAGQRLRLSGSWRNTTVDTVIPKLLELRETLNGHVEIDITGISSLDTSGAWIIRRIELAASKQGDVQIVGGSDAMRELISALPEQPPLPEKVVDRRPFFQRVLEPVGKMSVSLFEDVLAMSYVLGSAVRGTQSKERRGGRASIASIVNQLDHMGLRAVPIILLMSFLIGAIIAQQGAFQLRYFGAEVFVVDLVGILQLREIGVLLTAIMIAGRSGSAITAEIGSMKMREEVDALKVIGLNPIGVLVLPRIVALVIALPLLTVIANFAALYGAAVVSFAYSGITFQVFVTRLHDAVDYATFAAGLIKAPFMAVVIGIVAAVEGMKVGGSAESLGQHVTASVVKSIFVVILMDGLFAVFYAAINF
ncbi:MULTISPECIES: ABC transporter permease [Rhizobium/Agrobacterium group]|uniref:ABC transporter membrane spanning protein n=2 Tax=Rhizobium/Agrobacterium group TaxID=227290 RepID=B9JVS8_ALLAM|nr:MULTISPECIES: ABC transporter permease [Rhizobium/Agrobacterium group]ACM36358.1 ABC transporter membrane spanning protein [Allorhizobium ampelinum S4]MUO27760.1 MlaE family lipid ABC transporter permease subunit [Agrobacterium vitis]MUO44180.1 MlaE family lipid ABC transporter permease subunit [Agrobacterium vitis]MUP12371.1 MlaE family lipid ABC transporter permease subunit [Agrobacterium vitis]MVA60543.1 MlaE family lipid ABC transporter permease subunit [Agrobacterium vitis]